MAKLKDPVFLAAAAIFVLALVMFSITQDQMWLVLLTASYLLRTTLASLGVARARVDERQMIIHYRSGNIAYGITNTVALIFAAINLAQGQPYWITFVMLVFAGVIARLLFVMIIAQPFQSSLGQNLQFSIRAAFTYFRKNLDEWQLQVHYRSGNIAFAAALFAACFFCVYFGENGDHIFEMLASVIMLGLASKAVFNVLLVKDYRLAASKMIMGVGLLIALFMSFEAFGHWEIVLVILPGLAVAGMGWLAQKFPRIIGSIILGITLLLLLVVFIRNQNWGGVATALLVCGPMLLASVCLFIPSRNPVETDSTDSLTKGEIS